LDPRAVRGFVAGVGVVVLAALAALALAGRLRTPPVPPPPPAPVPVPDVEARLDAAQGALDRQDLMTTFTETQAVLERDPGNPRALTYQAMVRLEMGQPDTAFRMLEEARTRAPDSIAAYAYSAMAYVRAGRTREAEALIADAKARFPDQAAILDGDLARMKEQAAREGPLPSPGAADPHADVLPPVPTAPGSHEHASEEPLTVAGRLEMDPALRDRLPQRVVVFVTLRAAGDRRGRVLATRRVETSSFPVFFEVGPRDTKDGAPLPSRVLVEGRVDTDGDPATRSPSDLAGRVDGVAPGRFDLRVFLQRPAAGIE
jgi:hypothetical protein